MLKGKHPEATLGYGLLSASIPAGELPPDVVPSQGHRYHVGQPFASGLRWLSEVDVSLKKAVGVELRKSGWLFPKWRFFFSKTQFFELSHRKYERAREAGLVAIGSHGGRTFWWTDSGFYWADPDLSDEEVELLVWDRERRQEARLDRLRKIRARDEEATEARRRPIPEEVRAFVWKRDEGRCLQCGSEDDLQFDHVIPVAKGGGNAMDNIQILCGDCNRLKSDSIV